MLPNIPGSVALAWKAPHSLSEVELHGHLDHPRCLAVGIKRSHLAKGRAAGDGGAGVVPVRVIQNVEQVGPELQLIAFGELELASYVHIPTDHTRPVEGIAGPCFQIGR